ncbi:hypothetical protein PS623_04239 [Pseudomonas fluorescens]|nr:hypothetical protein PS623_04239 [Pseudomonas fluorescens]
MAVGFIELAATWQPDHLLGTKVILQAPGHFCFAQMSVAIAVEQALLGGQQAALAVTLDAAEFCDQRRAVAVQVFDLEDLASDLVVLVPWVVEATVEAAIGVELEVDAAYLAAVIVDHEARSAVAKPGVIASHLHYPHRLR